MKLFTALLVLSFALTGSSSAATFKAKRGIALDIWVTWPNQDQWSDEKIILPFPEWRKTVGKAQLQKLKASGLDFVRIPVDPAVFLVDETASLRDRLFDEVNATIDLAQSAGLKVIIDAHFIPKGPARTIGTDEVLADPKLFEKYLDFLRTLGSTIKDRDPTQVALELFNEPTNDCEDSGTNNWPAMLKQSFAAARASATNLTLILSGSCWGSAEGLVKLKPTDYPDDNLMWSFHSYDPFIITHQGASWTGNVSPLVYGLPFPIHATPKAELDATMDTIRKRIRKEAAFTRVAGITSFFEEEVAKIDTEEELNTVMDKPFDAVAAWAKDHAVDPSNIILGEFGIIRQEYNNPVVIDAKVRAAFYKSQIERAEKRGFSWSMWGYGGAFGIAEEFEGRRAEPDVLDMIKSLPN
ncbi:MAG: glycoside hydrolase family 5 protein [Rhizobiaceae bacterium]